jgi:hypothetical protein
MAIGGGNALRSYLRNREKRRVSTERKSEEFFLLIGRY